MMASVSIGREKLERCARAAGVDVSEAEYRRLLGYPRDHVPGERAQELAAWARRWYAENGNPWTYLREAEVEPGSTSLRLDGVEFSSRRLHDYFRAHAIRRAMLVAVSAGSACEAFAQQLWQEGKPDEYFFLEMFGSAVVEELVSGMSGQICDLAERVGLRAIRHYSPGYTGWDVADQTKLLPLIVDGAAQPFPESLAVLSSGMLKPKKSLLAVFGLVARDAEALTSQPGVPCAECGFSPCAYRRAPYRHAGESGESRGVKPLSPLTSDAKYTVAMRALQKWSTERVQIERVADGTTVATFRFDGTTCSNMGRPLAFDYRITLGSPETGYQIIAARCEPAPGDDGYRSMCAYLSDADALMQALATEKPLLGRPLADVLTWSRASTPSGCHCTEATRTHKWGLALEAIHYALAHASATSAPSSPL